MEHKIIIYTDGGARGNPGPASIGVVIEEENTDSQAPRMHKEYSEYIGIATNNVAEYKAVIFALKKTKQLLGKKRENSEIELRTDSELIYKQMTGQYKIKDQNLQPLFIEVWNLKQDFPKVEFKHVRRELNKEADRLVNQAQDLGI
ncbi:MAG: ribonuclease HI family protein [Candidatus Colwellbacteria bacterium]|nr:ribonuclease HI family protein [Candidatus Colwellbacteria bacterium]